MIAPRIKRLVRRKEHFIQNKSSLTLTGHARIVHDQIVDYCTAKIKSSRSLYAPDVHEDALPW